ncbi:MAG TPA: hypothetical protein ACYCC7_00415 [Candidatus Azoamicus sp. MARI]
MKINSCNIKSFKLIFCVIVSKWKFIEYFLNIIDKKETIFLKYKTNQIFILIPKVVASCVKNLILSTFKKLNLCCISIFSKFKSVQNNIDILFCKLSLGAFFLKEYFRYVEHIFIANNFIFEVSVIDNLKYTLFKEKVLIFIIINNLLIIRLIKMN